MVRKLARVAITVAIVVLLLPLAITLIDAYFMWVVSGIAIVGVFLIVKTFLARKMRVKR